MTDPFVRLMRTYCIDYTNSHDLSVCDSIMEPDYVVHIAGIHLKRDSAYKLSVERVFERFPNLGLVVHELVTNGDRLAMRFSEHGSTVDGRLACWSGVGLYSWNGRLLTSCRVEQDFWSQQRQLQGGSPDRLDAPHIDPWTTTYPGQPNPTAEVAVRSWLEAGDLAACRRGRIDEGTVSSHVPILDANTSVIHDIFSAGDFVAFHATLSGSYAGGLSELEDCIGKDASLDVAGIVTVSGGCIDVGHIVTDRFGTSIRLRS